jgi:hypothetical protein
MFKTSSGFQLKLMPVVYEKYNYLLSMNINAEIYKFSFTEKNFSKCAHLLTFFQSISIRNWKVWDLVSAPLSDLENVSQLL